MITEQIKAKARRWVVELSDAPSRASRAACERWLAESPWHRQAYESALNVWSAVGEMRHLVSMIDEGNTASDEPNAAKSAGGRSHQRRNAPWFKSQASFGAWAALFLVALGSGLIVQRQGWFATRPVLSSAVAEVRSVAMSDGSTVTLGARSKVRVQFSAGERRLFLDEGEAVFSVARDARRPFIVSADGIDVRAVGTQFEVHRGADRIRVAVIEGVVDVAHAPSPGGGRGGTADVTQRVSAGQQLLAAPRGNLSDVLPVAASQPGAWRDGTLRYTDASLADVIADANRYYAGHITLGDSTLAALRVTTSFGAHQVQQFLDSLPSVLPVRLERPDNERVVLLPLR